MKVGLTLLFSLAFNHQTARFQFGDIFHFSCTALNTFNKRWSFDNFVSGIPPSLLFKTISRDQLSETSVSSSSLVPTVILYLSRLWFIVVPSDILCLPRFWYIKLVSECCLMPNEQYFSYIMVRISCIHSDVNNDRFVLNQHA